jgi:hypothetical protein
MDIETLHGRLQTLVAELGTKPYGFFAILGVPGDDRLDLRAQNQRWDFIRSETWHSLDLSTYLVWAISDNGDLLWWNGDRTIAMDPRSTTFISEPVDPRQFIRLAGMGKLGKIFPVLTSTR